MTDHEKFTMDLNITDNSNNYVILMLLEYCNYKVAMKIDIGILH